jgi:hypothetical protein
MDQVKHTIITITRMSFLILFGDEIVVFFSENRTGFTDTLSCKAYTFHILHTLARVRSFLRTILKRFLTFQIVDSENGYE